MFSRKGSFTKFVVVVCTVFLKVSAVPPNEIRLTSAELPQILLQELPKQSFLSWKDWLQPLLPISLLSVFWLYSRRRTNKVCFQIKNIRDILEQNKFDAKSKLKLLLKLDQLKSTRTYYTFFQYFSGVLVALLVLEPLFRASCRHNHELYKNVVSSIGVIAGSSAAAAIVYYFLYHNADPESLLEEKTGRYDVTDHASTEDASPWQVYRTGTLQDFQLKNVEMPGAVSRVLYDISIFLQHPEKAFRLNTKPVRGVLLSGPPGCGKSMVAKAFANHLGFNFIGTTGSEFVRKYVGTGAIAIKKLFEDARNNAPCVLFIDEIDSIARSRSLSASEGSLEYQRALNQLLAELDGKQLSENWDGVFVVAATNLPESLDRALLRDGRLGKVLTMSAPDLKARAAIFKRKLALARFKVSVADLENLARESIGMSGARITETVNVALLEVAKQDLADQEVWPTAILFDSLERSQLGEPDDSFLAAMDEEDRKIVAYHEAGHALVALLSPNANPLRKITIIPRIGGCLGLTLCLPKKDCSLMNKDRLNAEIQVCLGSIVAERLIFGKHTNGVRSDLSQARYVAKSMVRDYGMLPDDSITFDKKGSELQVNTIIENNLKAVESLLQQPSSLEMLHKLAAALLQYRTIDDVKVREILGILLVQAPSLAGSGAVVGEPLGGLPGDAITGNAFCAF